MIIGGICQLIVKIYRDYFLLPTIFGKSEFSYNIPTAPSANEKYHDHGGDKLSAYEKLYILWLINLFNYNLQLIFSISLVI